MDNLNGHSTWIEHSEAQGVSIETMGKRFARTFPGVPFDRHATPQAGQFVVITGKKGGLSATKTDTDNVQVRTTYNGQRTTDGHESAQTNVTGQIKQADMPARTKTVLQIIVLWGVMALCAAISTHNMAYISGEITGIMWVSWCITALFTVGPFAMIWAGVKWWGVSAACILVEVFCNTTGIFRGLAGLKSSPFENYQTGSFIDSLSTLVNLPQRTCAVGIAAIFAGLVAGVFVVCLIETRK